MTTATMERKRLVTGEANPADKYALVPPDKHFEDADSDFLDAGDLREIAVALIGACEEFEHLSELVVTCAWKRAGGGSGGRSTLGKCVKAAGLVKYFGQVDFVVWVAADHARDYELTNWQVEALVYHELLHAGVTDKGKPSTRGHDYEAFVPEVRRYGAWKADLIHAAAAFRQLSLDEALGRPA